MDVTSRRILIVEDDPLILEVIKTAFDEEKHHLLTAWTIADAEKILKKTGIDLLVLDRMLPDGDGLQL